MRKRGNKKKEEKTMLNIQTDHEICMMEVKGDILTIGAEIGGVINSLYNQISSEEGREFFKDVIKVIVNDYPCTWKLDETTKDVKIDGKAMEAILRKMRGEERG